VSSPITSQWKKTATGSCIEIFGFYCLLTNYHVVPSASVAEETVCYFGLAGGVASFKVKLNPALIFWSINQNDLDCSIIALAVQANLPHCVRPMVPDYKSVEVGDIIQVWGHPNIPGKPLQQSAGLVAKITDFTLHYRADTLDGFSGSPVISILSGKLVGLHCGGPWKSFPEAGNTGTSILSILDKFNQEFPIASIMCNSPSSVTSKSHSYAGARIEDDYSHSNAGTSKEELQKKLDESRGIFGADEHSTIVYMDEQDNVDCIDSADY